MDIQKVKVIEQMKKAKKYGLSYKKLAEAINLTPVTIYMFLNGTHNLSNGKQVEALCYISKYMQEIRERLRTIEVYI